MWVPDTRSDRANRLIGTHTLSSQRCVARLRLFTLTAELPDQLAGLWAELDLHDHCRCESLNQRPCLRPVRGFKSRSCCGAVSSIRPWPLRAFLALGRRRKRGLSPSRSLIAEGDDRYLWTLGTRRAEASGRQDGGRLPGLTGRTQLVLAAASEQPGQEPQPLLFAGSSGWAGQGSNLRPWD